MTAIRSTFSSPARVFKLAASIALGAAFLAASPARAETITGLVSGPGVLNGLVSFDSATPGTVSAVVSVTGLQLNESLIGIDYRPFTGVLYGVGNLNNLYTINPTTGAVLSATALTAASGSTFAGLSGTFFGFDFNPVPDLLGMPSLRVISNTNQNLRINVNAVGIGQVNTDSTITPTGLSIVGSAYSNNDTNPSTGTTLFGLSSNANSLVQASNANLGTYVTVDPLGIDPSSFVGFDISSSGNAFAGLILDSMAPANLYAIDYLSAAGTNANRATLIGTVGLASTFNLTGIAVVVTPVPEPATVAMMGLGLAALGAVARRRRNRG